MAKFISTAFWLLYNNVFNLVFIRTYKLKGWAYNSLYKKKKKKERDEGVEIGTLKTEKELKYKYSWPGMQDSR